jgi:Sulfotransferase family
VGYVEERIVGQDETTPSPADSGDRRFFFVHIQKTAGTSLFMHLRRIFAYNEVYPNRSDGDPHAEAPQVSVHHLTQRWRVRGDEIRLVAGHFPLCTTELLGGGFTTLTVLREPVERTLSYLRHFRASTPAAGDTSLEEIYEDPVRFPRLVHNHMVKMFALQPSEMTIGMMMSGMMTELQFTPAHLERAKAQLETVDAIGLQERFDEFRGELEHRFGWHFGDAIYANRTEPENVSAELRARIAHDNALDVELYEFARQLTASRLRSRS